MKLSKPTRLILYFSAVIIGGYATATLSSHVYISRRAYPINPDVFLDGLELVPILILSFVGGAVVAFFVTRHILKKLLQLVWYTIFMNDYQIDDLKQFITATLNDQHNQHELRLAKLEVHTHQSHFSYGYILHSQTRRDRKQSCQVTIWLGGYSPDRYWACANIISSRQLRNIQYANYTHTNMSECLRGRMVRSHHLNATYKCMVLSKYE